MSEPNFDLHPAEARWTHIALRVKDAAATISWYTAFTPLELIEQREDDDGYGAWLGMAGKTNNPFILVIAQFFDGKDPFAAAPRTVLGPFAHLGIELTTQADVDAMAERGKAEGCLAMPATMMPAPIGYICMLNDPDGNTVEFSWDQGVYTTLNKRYGDSTN